MAPVRFRRPASRNTANWRVRIRYGNKYPADGAAMSQPQPFWVRHAALVFSLRTFAAAMLAFSLALLLDMPRPYWAMASVYITSNQFTGATYSKAVYRILGTLIGGGAGSRIGPS